MQFTPKKSVKRFQQGGPVVQDAPMAEEEMPAEGGEEMAPQGQQDPLMMLAQGAAQALQAQDCQIAMQVCQGLLELLQQMSGGSAPEAQGEPVFARNGAKLVRRIKK